MTEKLLEGHVRMQVTTLKRVVNKIRFSEEDDRLQLIDAINSFEDKLLEAAGDLKLDDISYANYRAFSYEVSLQLAVLIHSAHNTFRLNNAFHYLSINLTLLPRTNKKELEYMELIWNTVEAAYDRIPKQNSNTKLSIRDLNHLMTVLYEDMIVDKLRISIPPYKRVQIVETVLSDIGVTIDTDIRSLSVKYLEFNFDKEAEVYS